MRKNYPYPLVFLLAAAVFIPAALRAQHFSGLEGTVYGGAVNSPVQPAAAAGMPFRWDLHLIGLNTFFTNNIYQFAPRNDAYKSDDNEAGAEPVYGDLKRWGALTDDVHILNALYAVDHRLTVGAGLNFRSYLNADRMRFMIDDDMKGPSTFLKGSSVDEMKSALVVNQNWMEFYVTAATIRRESAYETWKVGGTLKLLKGSAAEFADITALQIAPLDDGSNDFYFLKARGRFGYSDNLDSLETADTFKKGKHVWLNGSGFSAGLDLGVSYLHRRWSAIPGIAEETPGNYDWKIEASLTDIGRLKYHYGGESRHITGGGKSATLSRFQNAIDGTATLAEFNDSLAAIMQVDSLGGETFTVSLPTALRINFDKYLGRNFYVNASLLLNASFLSPADYKVHMVSYLMLTPRWETRRIAVSLPLYLNEHGDVMLGGALRLGPLVAGFHDFHWLTRRPFRNGGGYIGIIIRHLWPAKAECPQ